MLVQIFRYHPGTLRSVPVRESIQRINHRAWFPPFDTTRWDWFRENSGQVAVSALANRSAIVRDSNLVPQLPGIRKPVLLIRCEGEGLIGESCQQALEQGLANVSTERMLGTGHVPYLTHPHRLVKVVRSFLSPGEPEISGQGR
jgi:pimeloyl-ACP methyl ester carboxylesterase